MLLCRSSGTGGAGHVRKCQEHNTEEGLAWGGVTDDAMHLSWTLEAN